jgi:hypothetical protein
MYRSARSVAFGVMAWEGWRLILYIQELDYRDLVQRN